MFGGLEDDARPEGVPVCGTLLRESHLSWATRQELLARVPDDADAGDLDVEAVVADCDDSPDDPLRDAAVPERPLDAGRHLGAVRQRHGQRVDWREPFWVKGIHSARLAAGGVPALRNSAALDCHVPMWQRSSGQE